MFIILPSMCFITSTLKKNITLCFRISRWEEAVPLCTYMICKTAIIITGLILVFFAVKYLIVNIYKSSAQKNRDNILLNKYDCNNCSNYSSTKAKAEGTGNIAPNNNNNNNETKGV